MAFTNSSLVTYTKISPFKNSPRNQPISKITIHHMAGVASLETFGNIVTRPGRNMSANYAIDKDARIGLFCDEQDRSWCSSSSWNDNRAITIEVSNSSIGGDWPISDKVYAKLIDLCVDICKRNGIKQLTYTGNKEGSLTFHSFYYQTACPGPYIKARAQEICDKVNARRTVTEAKPTTSEPSTDTTKPVSTSVKKNDLVSIASNATYYTGASMPSWVKQEKWYVSSISGDRAVLGLNEAKNRNIQSPVNTKFLSVVNTSSNTTSGFKSYTVNLKSTDLLYATPGGNTKGNVGTTGVFTIVEEKTVNGCKYGKLKSGAGWVRLSVDTTIRKGSLVSLKSDAVYYNGSNIPKWVKSQKWYVSEISGDRAVLGQNEKRNQNIQSPINTKYLY